MTRGLKNNNPGNLVKTSSFFLGEKKESTDTRFRQFTTIEYGYRAMFVMLIQWIDTKGLNTIEKIITRWAPSNENDTKAYITNLAKYVGISKTKAISSNDEKTLKKLVAGISKIENGVEPNQAQINAGYNLINTKTMAQPEPQMASASWMGLLALGLLALTIK